MPTDLSPTKGDVAMSLVKAVVNAIPVVGGPLGSLMSDDREITKDSRVWGAVNKSAISGKAWIRYWPLKELGTPVK